MRNMVMAGLLALASVATQAAVKGEEVTYQGGGATMKGYVAVDTAIKGPRPAVLVVHEWWGHNAYARKRADMLAAMGYVAMAVDMYGDGKRADHPDNAMAFMQEAVKDPVQAVERFNAALALLRARADVDGTRIAAIGYCFGGAVVLNMARIGTDLKGVASFHGALGAWRPVAPGAVSAKVLVLNGAADTMVTAEQVAAFEQEMRTARADFRVVNYPGAKHSFTNPEADDFARRFSMPVGYDAAADQASWAELAAFLQDVLAPAREVPRPNVRY